MNGENLFKLLSLSLLGILFVSIASANKDIKPAPKSEQSLAIVFSHINMAAQANAFNSGQRVNPPEMTVDSKTNQESLPKSKE